LRFLYLHASDIHHNARSMEAEQQLCSKTLTPEMSLQNLRTYKDVDLVQFLKDWLTYAAVKRKGCRVPQRVWKMFLFYVIKRYEMRLW